MAPITNFQAYLKQSEGDFEFEVSLSVSKEKPRKKGRRFVRSGPLKLELRILCGCLDCHAGEDRRGRTDRQRNFAFSLRLQCLPCQHSLIEMLSQRRPGPRPCCKFGAVCATAKQSDGLNRCPFSNFRSRPQLINAPLLPQPRGLEQSSSNSTSRSTFKSLR